MAEEQEMITSLEQVEQVVNGYARKLARKQGVREDIFSVHLVRKLSRGDMSVMGGPHVDIYLLWPAVQTILNTKLNSAFTLIRKKNLWTPMAIATHAYFAREAGEGKKWIRQKLGPDVAESLGSLIPRHRLQVITTTVVEVKDSITGVSVIGTTQKIGDYRDADVRAWSILSQNVIDKHPESMDYDSEPKLLPPPPETPELDSVIEVENSVNG